MYTLPKACLNVTHFTHVWVKHNEKSVIRTTISRYAYSDQYVVSCVKFANGTNSWAKSKKDSNKLVASLDEAVCLANTMTPKGAIQLK